MNDHDLQVELIRIGHYKGKADGIIGPRSKQAIADFLGVNRIGYHKWGDARRLLAAKQMVCRLHGIDAGIVDGLMGPQTRFAFEVFNARLKGLGHEAETWRDNEASEDEIQKIDLVRPTWPRQAEVEKFFGKPGLNQAIIQLPFEMRIAWDRGKTIQRMSCHEKVAEGVVRTLERIADHYDHAARQRLGLDLFGGCLNVRKMRGGSAWSMHSWGIAIDFDPERNQLRWGRDRAFLARAECEQFWKLWEEEGWLSLGRARNFDWMHIQAARL